MLGLSWHTTQVVRLEACCQIVQDQCSGVQVSELSSCSVPHQGEAF